MENNNGLWIIAIVAIVAVVSLVLMTERTSTRTSQKSTTFDMQPFQDSVGHALTAGTCPNCCSACFDYCSNHYTGGDFDSKYQQCNEWCRGQYKNGCGSN
jgi:hypothetical protein